MLDALPVHVVGRICLWLRDVRDASALQQTCRRLRWAGFGPECKWHWHLTPAQSGALYQSPMRDRILRPGTAVHTLDLWGSEIARDVSMVGNVHTLHGNDEQVMTAPDSVMICFPWPSQEHVQDRVDLVTVLSRMRIV